MKKNKSIINRTNSVFITSIVLVVSMVIIILLVGASLYISREIDSEADRLFRSVNSLVLLLQQSPDKPTAEIAGVYNEIMEPKSFTSGWLRDKTFLPEPDYHNADTYNEYRGIVRSFAAGIGDAQSELNRRLLVKIGLMLIFAVLASISILVNLFFWKRGQYRFFKRLDEGFERLDEILLYREPSSIGKDGGDLEEIKVLDGYIERVYRNISYNRSIQDTNIHGNLNVFMESVFAMLQKELPCQRIALAFLDRSGNVIAETAVSSYADLVLEPGFVENISDTHLGEILENGGPRIINDLPAHAAETAVSEATRMVLAEGIQASITVPMLFNGQCLGFFFISSTDRNVYTRSDADYAYRIVNLLKQKLYIEYLMQQVIAETSNSFVVLMGEKDNETSLHIHRMSMYSHIIARAYHSEIEKLSPRFMREILWYSPLHDIGKIGTPDAILLKNGKLTDEEMTVMKGHVDIGIRVMRTMNENLSRILSVPLLDTAIDIISGHHERFEGGGYPRGLSGEQIPLAGRIVAAADVFDALTSRRPYKDAFSVDKALGIMYGDMKGHFDPQVLKAFKIGMPGILEVYERFKEV